MSTRTSEKLPLGTRNFGYRLDPATWPDGAECVLTLEVSDDGGKTWRINSWVKAKKEETDVTKPFGGSLIFRGENGNENPDFMVRSSAKFDDTVELDMATAVETIDDTTLMRDRPVMR